MLLLKERKGNIYLLLNFIGVLICSILGLLIASKGAGMPIAIIIFVTLPLILFMRKKKEVVLSWDEGKNKSIIKFQEYLIKVKNIISVELTEDRFVKNSINIKTKENTVALPIFMFSGALNLLRELKTINRKINFNKTLQDMIFMPAEMRNKKKIIARVVVELFGFVFLCMSLVFAWVLIQISENNTLLVVVGIAQHVFIWRVFVEFIYFLRPSLYFD